jgi:AraC-like DNA-binding protein
MGKTLSSSTMKMAIVALERMGASVDESLKNAGLSRSKLLNPLYRIPIAAELVFWKSVANKMTTPYFAVEMVKNVPFGTFALLEYVGASCQSLFQVLSLFGKYVNLIYGNWHPALTLKGDEIVFDLGVVGLPEDYQYSSVFGLGLLLERLRYFSEMPVPIKRIHFRHKLRGDLKVYERILEAPIFFEQNSDSLFFETTVYSISCKNSDSLMLGSLLKVAEKLANGLSQSNDDDFTKNVKEKIKSQLDEGEPDLDRLSKSLGVSKRSLQRRLEAQKTSLKKILVDVRKQLADEYLSIPQSTHEDIAMKLGYSSLSAFNRAFKQWYDMTPSEYKKTLEIKITDKNDPQIFKKSKEGE